MARRFGSIRVASIIRSARSAQLHEIFGLFISRSDGFREMDQRGDFPSRSDRNRGRRIHSTLQRYVMTYRLICGVFIATTPLVLVLTSSRLINLDFPVPGWIVSWQMMEEKNCGL